MCRFGSLLLLAEYFRSPSLHLARQHDRLWIHNDMNVLFTNDLLAITLDDQHRRVLVTDAEAGATRVTFGAYTVPPRPRPHGVLSKKSLNDGHQPSDPLIPVLAEEIGAMNRCQRAATAYFEVGQAQSSNRTGISHGMSGRRKAQLLHGERELFVLVALGSGSASTRKACDEDEGIVGDSSADHPPPVLTRPQGGGITPHRDSSGFENSLQLVDVAGILPHIGDECVPGRLFHNQ